MKRLAMLSKLRALLKRLPVIVHGWGPRQRMIIFFIVMVAIIIVWAVFGLLPLSIYNTSLRTEQALLLKEIGVLGEKARLIVQDASNSDNAQNLKKHKDLQAKIKELNKTLSIYKNELIPAKEMSTVLRDILQKSGNMKLVELKALTPEKIQNGSKDVLYKEKALYRRSISMKFTGSFADTYNYLKQLEALKWRFFWDSLSYTVTKYPEATVTMKVETLSTTQGGENAK